MRVLFAYLLLAGILALLTASTVQCCRTNVCPPGNPLFLPPPD